VPAGSLKYLLSQGYAQGAPSGFSTLNVAAAGAPALASSAMSFDFYSAADGEATLLYTSPLMLPRLPIRDTTGAIVAMAAPDYQAAGLPRPSAVSPFAPYPQSAPGAEARSIDFEAQPSALAPATQPSAPAAAREMVIWLYAPTATQNATWDAWYTDLLTHRNNVTGVAPCSYVVSSDGAFGTQMPSAETAAMAASWTRRMANELGLAVYPLIAASGAGMNLLIRQGGAAAAAFIAATVAELRAVNGSGYNVQLEEPGNSTIKAEWETFLGAWADALAPATISIILGGDCRARDWMYMDCGDYKLLQLNHSNIRAITEATYEKEPSAWLDFERNIVRGLGLPVAQLGLEYGPPLLNAGNGCLPAAKAAGITTLYIWVNTPEGTGNQTAWDALGWWLAPNE
jgi:hypothetical protein